MKRKMARLSGRPIEETSEDEDNEEESASEQEELANDESTLMAEENVTRARLILDDMDENMNSKVNDLMANLGGNFEGKNIEIFIFLMIF